MSYCNRVPDHLEGRRVLTGCFGGVRERQLVNEPILSHLTYHRRGRVSVPSGAEAHQQTKPGPSGSCGRWHYLLHRSAL